MSSETFDMQNCSNYHVLCSECLTCIMNGFKSNIHAFFSLMAIWDIKSIDASFWGGKYSPPSTTSALLCFVPLSLLQVGLLSLFPFKNQKLEKYLKIYIIILNLRFYVFLCIKKISGLK